MRPVRHMGGAEGAIQLPDQDVIEAPAPGILQQPHP
jgi:hypothetical protein